MSAFELLRGGNLSEALAMLQSQVRKEPAESKHRVFLFQLLAVKGDWERAVTQLSVAAEMDAAAIPMAQTYREAIRCEKFRDEVFAGRRPPLLLGEPDQWLALLLESLRLQGEGEPSAAADLHDQAFEAAPAVAGTLETRSDESATPFTWIADADSRLGPVLEAIVNGSYYWIAFDRITQLDIDPPEDLRDVVWMPAHFQWVNGGEAVGLIPTRYAGSNESEDTSILLSRRTEWQESSPEAYTGLGQRILATNEAEYALMDIRRIKIENTAGDLQADPEEPSSS